MAEPFKHIYNVDLSEPLKRFDVGGILASGDEKANSFEVVVSRNGANVDLAGCTVIGYFIRPNDETMKVDGTAEGNRVRVEPSRTCYVYDGEFSLAIKIIGNGITQTIAVFDGRIVRTTSENIVDGDRVFYSLEQMLEQIEATEAAANNASTAADRANDAAAAIENATASAQTLATGQAATVSVTDTDSGKHFSFGLPRGDKGDRGESGVHVGSSAPTDPSVNVWIDPAGTVDPDDPVDAKTLGGKPPEHYLQPRNLLDNSYFRNPVNQRVYEVYNTNGYTIDRWVLYYANWANFKVENGLTFNVASAGCSFFQRIDKKTVAIGTDYTLAYVMDGVLHVQDWIFAETGNDFQEVAIIIPEGTHTLDWAALYEGTYTTETLPPYVPKGYAAELAECQRYYVQHDFTEGLFVGRVYGTDAYKADVTIPIAGNLRLKAPTMVNELTAQQCFIGTEMHTGMVTADYINVSSGCISLTFHSDNALIPSSMCVLRLMGRISFSADL